MSKMNKKGLTLLTVIMCIICSCSLLSQKKTSIPIAKTIHLSSSTINFVSLPSGFFLIHHENKNSFMINYQVEKIEIDSLLMSSTEITVSQYIDVTGDSNLIKRFNTDNNCPVRAISWYDAIRFCNKLSEISGNDKCYNDETWECDFSKNGFRLPTELEWLHACKAGTETNYYTGDNESDLSQAGWWIGNSDKQFHIVGQKEPNVWGTLRYAWECMGMVSR